MCTASLPLHTYAPHARTLQTHSTKRNPCIGGLVAGTGTPRAWPPRRTRSAFSHCRASATRVPTLHHAHDHVLRAPTGRTAHPVTLRTRYADCCRSTHALREPTAIGPAPAPPRLCWALVHGGGRGGLLVVGPLLDGAVHQPQHDAVEADEDGRDRRAQQRLRAREVTPRALDDEVAEGVGAAQEVVATRLVRVRVRVGVRVGVGVGVGVGFGARARIRVRC